MAALVVLGSLLAWLIVAGHATPSRPDAVEITFSHFSQDDQAGSVSVKQHCPGPVLLMNWILEQKAEGQWKRVDQARFPGGQILDRGQGFNFSVLAPTRAGACRLKVQYGLGLHGVQLWRERVRLACKTGRFMAALRYNEWEACESIAELRH
jgi:hypothetical protein